MNAASKNRSLPHSYEDITVTETPELLSDPFRGSIRLTGKMTLHFYREVFISRLEIESAFFGDQIRWRAHEEIIHELQKIAAGLRVLGGQPQTPRQVRPLSWWRSLIAWAYARWCRHE